MSDFKHPRVGELRPTQMMFTFGVGAIVELPYISTLVMGLDDWPRDPEVTQEIPEDRLLQAVRQQLGPQVGQLLTPPVSPDTSSLPDPFSPEARIGAPVATFPRWMHCPRCQLLAPVSSGLFKLKTDPYHPERARYVHEGCPKNKSKTPPAVVPARFVVACAHGHLDDFPWVDFVHRGQPCSEPLLELIEYGPGGEARDLEVRCRTCDARRRMSEAFGDAGKKNMPRCRGRRPHLRDFEEHGCDQQVRTLLLGASNLWFPDVLTTLAIPLGAGQIDQLVEDNWPILRHVTVVEILAYKRTMGELGDLTSFSDEEIWEAIQRKRQRDEMEQELPVSDLKTPEWELFTHPDTAPETSDMKLRQVDVPEGFEDLLARVVLVERLREVRAMLGFTRLDPPGDILEEAAEDQRRMRLSRQAPTWVPASEIRGEGIFIQFREEAIQAWLQGRPQGLWNERFHDSHIAWRIARYIDMPEENYPGLRYVLIHSLSHILMRQLALEAGYVAASVRERIYSRNPNEHPDFPEPMAGLLIYTAAPDSEGTLGGLVGQGEPQILRDHLRKALMDAGLCASDPLCAEHPPSTDGITLHAAACHACMFAPETSCEQGNRYLDRSVLVPTIVHDDLAFFLSLP